MFKDNFVEPLTLTNHGIRLPEFKLADEDYGRYGISKDASNLEILTAICRMGFREKLDNGVIPKEKKREYEDRVKSETKTISELGFTDYILFVFDISNVARKSNLARNAGRGSAAGSLVNFLIGITDVDPIRYNLYFERFISISRAKLNIIDGISYLSGSLPDIDYDLGDKDREIIINYLLNKYDGKIVKQSTLRLLKSKVMIKELVKVALGYSEEDSKVASKLIPTRFNVPLSWEEAEKESLEFFSFLDKNPLIKQCGEYLYECILGFGSHASAYLVSYDKMDDNIPLQYGKSENSDEIEIVSSYDKDTAENLVIKMDLLGVQSLNLLFDAAKSSGIDLYKIDVSDYDTIYKHLQNLELSYGLFQISGHAVVNALNKIRPANLEELSDVISIARPGGFPYINQYADYKNGMIDRPNIDPIFDDILEPTRYICIYQEQLLKMLNKIGFTLSESDDIRRIVGKKKKDEIAAWEQKIYKRAEENGVSRKAAEFVWTTANLSADYLFNLSHGISYSVTAAYSCFIKFNYPKQFFLRALEKTQKMQHPYEEIEKIQRELPYFGIQLLPPDLVKSDINFKIEGDNIRFGLSAIKGVAEKAIPKLQTFLDKEKINKFQLFFAAKEAGLNIAILSALIQAGCLHSLGDDRARMTLEAQIWSKLNEREREYCLSHGEKYDYDLIVALKDYLNWTDKKPFKESRLDTIRKQTQPYIEIYNKNKRHPQFAAWAYERALLGFCSLYNLRQVFKNELENLQSADSIKNHLDKDSDVYYIGVVGETKNWKSKAGNQCFKMDISDETGVVTAMMTGEKLEKYLLASETPKEDEIVYIEGKKADNLVFINRMAVQNYKIAFNMRDLKKLRDKEDSKKENFVDSV